MTMNELILGLACFTFGVLIACIVWVICLDIASKDPQSEDEIIHEVIDKLKEKSDEEDRR